MSNENQEPVRVTGSTFTLFMSFVRSVDHVSFVMIVICMAMMAVLVAAQVFFRYALSSSIDSADELSRLFFVWAMFLAIPHGLKAGIHVGIDVLVSRLEDNIKIKYFLFVILASSFTYKIALTCLSFSFIFFSMSSFHLSL